jgi:hypothetical protein
MTTKDTTKTDTNARRADGTKPVEGPAENSDALGHNHEASPIIDGGLDGRMYAGNSNVNEAETDPKSVFNQAAISHSDAHADEAKARKEQAKNEAKART